MFPFTFSSFLGEFWDGYFSVFVSHFLYTMFYYMMSNPYFFLLHGEDMPQAPRQRIFSTVLVSLITYTISRSPVSPL